MTYLKNIFAGVIALLCTLTLSNTASAQVNPRDMVFSVCSNTNNFESVAFNQITNEVTLVFKDRVTPDDIKKWDSVEFRWFATVTTTLPKGHLFDSLGINYAWHPTTDSGKYACMSADIAVKEITFKDGVYTFICKFSPAQIKYLNSIKAVPGKCEDFSFLTLTTPY